MQNNYSFIFYPFLKLKYSLQFLKSSLRITISDNYFKCRVYYQQTIPYHFRHKHHYFTQLKENSHPNMSFHSFTFVLILDNNNMGKKSREKLQDILQYNNGIAFIDSQITTFEKRVITIVSCQLFHLGFNNISMMQLREIILSNLHKIDSARSTKKQTKKKKSDHLLKIVTC